MNRIFIFLSACILLVYSACDTIDLYEKSITVPDHAWHSSLRPKFDFEIKDTSRPYQVMLILRHTEKYSFNNLFVNLYIKGPGQDSAIKVQRDLTLGTNDKGWLGTGMDDIYEHRIPLTAVQSFRAGLYHFEVEQIMREDPLKNVLNVGLRIEKK